jgi:uncharacterized membrane protein YoaK (UPF0700 family)
MKKVSYVTGVLVLTAITAGLIDVLSFAKLGAIFTSAMTGNLALLGFYAATGAVHSAIKSLSAVVGFIVGCAVGTIQGRRKTNRTAVRRILGLETLMILVCAIGSMQSSLSARSDFIQAEIILLAFAMGLQSIVGTRTREESSAGEQERDAAVVVAYLIGALVAGVTIATHFAAALIIPVAAIGIAFIYARGVE